MSDKQTLTGGRTVTEQFANLGCKPNILTAKPRHIFGLLAGKPGCGKTSLLATCDSCLIINTDLSSVPVPGGDMKAVFWPVIGGERSQPLDQHGEKMRLDWDKVLAKQAQVFQMQDRNEPVPDLIAVDSIAGAIQLIKDWVVKRNGKESWRDLHGPSAWDQMNDELVGFANQFRQRGFGFYYTCHLVDSKVPIGEDLYRVMPEVTISASTWKRLNWQFEMVAVLEATWKTETVEIPFTTKVQGKEIKRVRKETQRKKVHVITTNREELAGITKGRVELNDVVLPRKNMWATFEELYEKAAQESLPF